LLILHSLAALEVENFKQIKLEINHNDITLKIIENWECYKYLGESKQGKGAQTKDVLDMQS